MVVKNYVEEYSLQVVGVKLALIGAFLIIAFLDIQAILNIWFALLYLVLFAGVIFGYFIRVACPHCYYHKERCSTGLGLVAGKLFPAAPKQEFEENYQKGFLPVLIVYLLPLVFNLIGFFTAPFLVNLIFIIMILALLFVLFVIHLKQACHKCYNKDFCPARQAVSGIQFE